MEGLYLRVFIRVPDFVKLPCRALSKGLLHFTRSADHGSHELLWVNRSFHSAPSEFCCLGCTAGASVATNSRVPHF